MKRSLMLRRLPMLLLAVLTVWPGTVVPVHAAPAAASDEGQAERSREDAGAQTNERQAGGDPGSGDDRKNRDTNRGRDQEIFRPSEEISEDFAVSFPVDI